MIPDHLIDQAAAAIYASTAFGDRFAIDAWYDMDDGNPFKVRTRELATAALEAVAAEIWQEGVNFALPGKETWAEAAHNPYKRNEHA